MVSLLKLATVTEEGVRFLSPHDGSPMYGAPRSVARNLSNRYVTGFLHLNTQSLFRTLLDRILSCNWMM